ncbi:MAG: hypothetical protein OEY14_15770, partial [Myxococcales bacterium]|nr:hypothetical protein [Myxococcales bacterium]
MARAERVIAEAERAYLGAGERRRGPKKATGPVFAHRARSFQFLGVLDPTFAAAGDTDAALAIIERKRSFHRDHATCLAR